MHGHMNVQFAITMVSYGNYHSYDPFSICNATSHL
jgi:hypothetical protein